MKNMNSKLTPLQKEILSLMRQTTQPKGFRIIVQEEEYIKKETSWFRTYEKTYKYIFTGILYNEHPVYALCEENGKETLVNFHNLEKYLKEFHDMWMRPLVTTKDYILDMTVGY